MPAAISSLSQFSISPAGKRPSRYAANLGKMYLVIQGFLAVSGGRSG
jgi:hypothetical protein